MPIRNDSNGAATKSIGAASERLAQQHLEALGCQIVATNFRAKVGEIDLICWDGPTLCFVEVRRRNNANFGGAAASVTLRKQLKIRRTAQVYLSSQQALQNLPVCRFDVVAIEGQKLEWLKAAF